MRRHLQFLNRSSMKSKVVANRKGVRHVWRNSNTSHDLTLRPDEDQGDILHVPVLRHLGVVIVDGIEARLVLETEHEDHRVDPRSELKQNETGRKNNGHKIEKRL